MASSTFYAKRPAPQTYTTKVADVRLPYDGTKWQEEIIGALHEQHPYLPNTQLQLSMNVRNVKQGYAIGNLNVSDRVRIPVIIDQFLLKPFDMFLKDGQLHPLNKSTLLAALEARNFGTATPPGQGESSDVFLTNSRPPYDGKYTFASAQDKHAFLGMFNKRKDQAGAGGRDPFHVDIKQLAATDHGMDDRLVQKLLSSPGGRIYLQMMLSGQVSPPKKEKAHGKLGAWTEGKPEEVEKALTNVFGADGAEYYMAGDPAVKEVLENARKGDFSKMKHHGSVRKMLETNAQRKIAMVKQSAVHLPDQPTDELVAGTVKVANAGGALVGGLLFDRVYDLAFGTRNDALFFVEPDVGFDNNRVFYGQQSIKQAELKEFRKNFQNIEPNVGDTGVWFWFEGDKLACTSVARIVDRQQHSQTYFVRGGGSVKLSHSVVTKNDLVAAGAPEGDTLVVPGTALWLPVPQKRAMYGRPATNFTRDYLLVQEAHGNVKVSVYQNNMRHVMHDAMLPSQAEKWLHNYYEPESVQTIMTAARNNGTVKIAAHPGMFVTETKTATIDLDTMLTRIREQAKVAADALFVVKDADFGPLTNYDTTALGKVDPMAAAIVKAATDIEDDERARSVDNVLGLNIINDQNIQRFLDGIDGLDRCKQFCMKLLLAARLGLNIDANAARTAAFALESIIQDLEQLRHATMSASDGE